MTKSLEKRHGLETCLRTLPSSKSDHAGVRLSVLADRSHINFRGDADDSRFVATARTIFGMDLPREANSSTGDDEQRILWLGPDEWLFVGSPVNATDLQKLDCATDLSGGQVLLRLLGSEVQEVLSKGCTIDLSSEKLPADACFQMGLAKATVLLVRSTTDEAYDLIVRRSFAEYVLKWLHNACREVGIELK